MHEPLTTPSQKFNRRLRFAAIASFCVSLPVFAWFVLFTRSCRQKSHPISRLEAGIITTKSDRLVPP